MPSFKKKLEPINQTCRKEFLFSMIQDQCKITVRSLSECSITLEKIESAGETVVVPKTEIGPEMGFYPVFTDTEGTKLGLHRKKLRRDEPNGA